MLIKKPDDIKSSEITDKELYLNRRMFIRGAALTGGALATGLVYRYFTSHSEGAQPGDKIADVQAPEQTVPPLNEKNTPYEDITHYNIFYEFSTDKLAVAGKAKRFVTRPWTVAVEGLVNKPRVFDIDDLLKISPAEERIYRHRCVERWSMVIPWVGFPLANFIKKCEPTSKAKYIEFQTLNDSKQMPGLRSDVLRWPYVEGLRMDEAMHPLTILVVGLYGEVLPNQDGAPLRLAVPWKYGFKHIKSIVRVKFVERQPLNTWQESAANEYGFYANVNPTVDHPRWTQATERRIGEFFRRKTLMFNGYGDQVASLYTGLDLKKN